MPREINGQVTLLFGKSPRPVSSIVCDQYTIWIVVHEIGWLQDYSAGLKQELIGWPAWAAGFDMIGVADI